MSKPHTREFHNSAYKSIFRPPGDPEESNEPRTVVPKKEIPFEFDKLGEALDRLDAVVGELHLQLGPVLSPKEETKESSDKPLLNRRTQYGQLISEYTREIDKETDFLLGILADLQV